MLLFRGGLDIPSATPEEIQQAMMKWKKWMEELSGNGCYLNGDRLTHNGKTIRTGKKVSDGPYTESKEIVGGYISIKADSLEEAVEIAKDCPIFSYNGSVEVREVAKQ